MVSTYNAHTEPIFKINNLLKQEDILKLQELKLYYNYVNNSLPYYFRMSDIRGAQVNR